MESFFLLLFVNEIVTSIIAKGQGSDKVSSR